MLTVLESRFMETMPRILKELANEVAALRKVMAELNQKLAEMAEKE